MFKYRKNIFIIIILACILAVVSSKVVFSANCCQNKATNQDKIKNEFRLKKEVLKFLPYQELDKLLDNKNSLVYMPYKELMNLIAEKSQPDEPAPVDYVIKTLQLDGEIKEDYIALDGDYKIEVLNSKWADIPVLSINTGLKNIDTAEANTPVIVDNSFFSLLSDKVGEHNLKLRFDVKSSKAGNNRVAKFNVPATAITKLKIKHPLNTMDFKISNSTGQKTEIKDNYKLTYANITGNGSVEINWKTATKAQKPVEKEISGIKTEDRPSKIISDMNTLVTIDEGLLQGFSDSLFKIYHSPVEKITFQIPDDIEIIEVSSPQNIVKAGGYKVIDPDEKVPGRILTVYFKSKVRDQVNLTIIYEKTFEDKPTTISIPDIYPVDKEINKVSGYLAIQTSGNSEIKPVASKSISRMDISDLPDRLIKLAEYPLIAAYSYIKNGYLLNFKVIPHKDASVQVAITDKAYADSRLSSNGMLTSQVIYIVRNMSEQFFKFNLPEKAEILSAAINGRPVQVEKQESENRKETTYFINIKNYQDINPFNLVVMYRQKMDQSLLNNLVGMQNLELPHILNIPILTISWSVYVPANKRYWSFTDLNPGERNYFNYITTSNSYSQGLSGDKTDRRPSQVQSNIMQDEDITAEYEGKVRGILPPEFSMPPAKGLMQFKFSDYLTGSDVISISMFGISPFIYFSFFVLLVYLIWRVLTKVHKYKFIDNKDLKEVLNSIIIELAGIMVLAIPLYSLTLCLLSLLTVAAYVIYHLIRLNAQNNQEL